MDLLKDEEFLKLEKEFTFLRRAREQFAAHNGELEKLTYVLVDIETTGLDPANDEIIEIGAIKVEGNEIKDVFNKLIKPEHKLSERITELTGISDDMLKSEMPIKPVISQFKDFIGDNILIAHNAEFDITFLKINFKQHLSQDLNNSFACTLQISRDLLPNLENHKLHTIAHYYGITATNRHRAIGDVELTYQVWTRFLDKLKDKNIKNRTDLETYANALAQHGKNAVSF